MYQTFKLHDDVSLVSGMSGHQVVKHHRIEKMLNNNRCIVLDDGSKWRQDGRAWGSDKGFLGSAFRKSLVSRKRGIEIEEWVRSEKNAREFNNKFAAILHEANDLHGRRYDVAAVRQLGERLIALANETQAPSEESAS